MDDKQQILLKILKDTRDNLDNAIKLLGGVDNVSGKIKIDNTPAGAQAGEAKIVEGIFAGDKMIGSDGSSYDVPPNYASKSRLVEGDIMKLTVTTNGNFVYKQIKPIFRKRVMGELVSDMENDEHWVVEDTNKWRVLKASVTYFKGQSGDKVAFLIPQDGPSKWAAVENIVRKSE